MRKAITTVALLFAFGTIYILNAQENKIVILNLKNGYSVKGEIIEQNDQIVKIKTADGQIFEYMADEIERTSEASLSRSSNLFSSSKKIPPVLVKSNMVAALGVGFIGNYSDNSSAKLLIPPLPITFEYIIQDNLLDGNGATGIGGFLGYSSTKQDFLYYSYKNSKFMIGVRGYFHYTFIEKLDTYGGVFLGYKSDNRIYKSDNYPDDKHNEGGAAINLFAGCRYFFNNKIAGMAELGWGLSVVTIGIAVKL